LNAINWSSILIAAQALSCGLIFVTNNEKEFQGIPGLQTKNWAALLLPPQ
jgi:predicted nucleic acid-binding protein